MADSQRDHHRTNTVQLSPILDMLGVSYVVSRGSPPLGVQPRFRSPDYRILPIPNALPRVFVPKRVEVVPSQNMRLWRLSQWDFSPRDVAYVEDRVDLPLLCRGAAEITNETPTGLLRLRGLETPGLLVLAVRWDTGWRALVDGRPAPSRGQPGSARGCVAAGVAIVEFKYEPVSVRLAFVLAAAAGLIVAAWLGTAGWLGRSVEPFEAPEARQPV